MKSIFEKIYYISPYFIQNIFVSLYGLKLYRERYSLVGNQHLEFIKKTQYYLPSDMEKLQEKEFLTIARHAIKTVPYYREWAKKQCINECDIKSLSDLNLFPIIRKEVLRHQPEEFVSDLYRNRWNLVKLNTSGTTASPLTVYCEPAGRSKHYAFFTRLRGWYGLDSQSRRATLFGRIIMLPKENSPPFWRYDIFQRNLLMSSYHLSEANIKFYYEKLLLYGPDEIIGYPSSLYQLANYINLNRLEPLSPKVIITTAETLLSYQKNSIEMAFKAPLVDQYGCTEMAFFASHCEKGIMHIHPEHGIVETVDENNINITDKPGSLIATGLINMVMPLIRYEIGDRVTLSSRIKKCECGRYFPEVISIEGRNDDIIYRKDGTPVGRLDPVFKGGSNIVSAKIVQDKFANIQVFIEPDKNFCDLNKQWLLKELKKRLGNDMEIKIKCVNFIEKGKSGKFKSVESQYNPRARGE